MHYDCVVKYADEDAGTFGNFRLPATPVPPPEEAATHHNVTYVMADKLDWTEIFEDTNHPAIPVMTPIPFTAPYHPPLQQDLHNVFDWNEGTKQRTDMSRRLDLAVETGTIQPPETAAESLTMQQH